VNYLEIQLNAQLGKRPLREWLAELDAAGVPAAPICNLAEVVTDPQLHARGMWHTLTDTDGKTLLTAGSPVTIDGMKPALAGSWPRLGEHNSVVRRDWLGESA
jgi:crotonobetainyl-CoA:carnitine CoA-transferase CaiB-like acyl-CoA transferase